MGLLRRLYRLPLLIVLLVLGLLGLVLVQPWLPMGGRRAMVRGWSRALLGVCGVAVHEEWGGQGTVSGGESGGENSRPVSGHADGPAVATSPAQKPAIAVTQPLATLAALAPGRMIVANHVSWLDVFAINSRATSAFVAKAEIREWPVVGWLVSLAGTVYIRRGDTKAVPDVIVQMQERLRTGFPVALFPEATTHVGPTLRKFHGKLLQAAIDEQADILPVGLQYRYADGTPAVLAGAGSVGNRRADGGDGADGDGGGREGSAGGEGAGEGLCGAGVADDVGGAFLNTNACSISARIRNVCSIGARICPDARAERPAPGPASHPRQSHWSGPAKSVLISWSGSLPSLTHAVAVCGDSRPCLVSSAALRARSS